MNLNHVFLYLRKHHEGTGLLVLKLLGTVPLPPHPRLVKEQLEEVIRQRRRGERPGSIEARTIPVATTERMSTRERDNLLVIEPHTAENPPQVVRALGSIRETTVWSGLGSEPVDTSGAPGDLGTAHLLDGSNAGQSPQIAVRDPGELLLEGLEELASNVQTGVGTVLRLRGEPHCSVVANQNQEA